MNPDFATEKDLKKAILNELDLLNGQTAIIRGITGKTKSKIDELQTRFNKLENDVKYIRRISIGVTILLGILLPVYNFATSACLTTLAKRADTNYDGVTSIAEWKPIYRELGLQYDELHPQPLSLDDSLTYLVNHPKK